MPGDALQLARTLRAGLRDAVSSLEDAAAGPAADPGWRSTLSARIHDVRTALITHIDEVEADGGLLDQAVAAVPGLAPAAAQVRDDHGLLCEEVDQVLDMVDPTHGEDDDRVRETVLDLMRMISRHRQRGADLVYEAWHLDIGAA